MIKKAVIFSIGFGGAVLIGNLAQAGQLHALLECRKIVNNDNRLACFDTAVRKFSAAGPNIPVDKASTKAVEINNFAKGQLRNSPVKQIRQAQQKTTPKELKTIRLMVVKHLYTNSGKFVLFMKNGQVWKQRNDGWIHLPKGDFAVKIEKGAFDSYNMIVPTRTSIIKVKRLR